MVSKSKPGAYHLAAQLFDGLLYDFHSVLRLRDERLPALA